MRSECTSSSPLMGRIEEGVDGVPVGKFDMTLAESTDATAQDPVDKRALRALMARSDGPGLRQAGLHFALIGCTGVLVVFALDTWWLWPAMLLHGIGLVFLFAAEHETAHRTAFKSRWLNEAVIWIAGLVVLLPPSYYRAFHFAHHRHTQDPDHDPELRFKRVDRWPGYLLYMSGLTYWKAAVVNLVLAVFGRAEAPFIGPRDRALIVRDCRIMAAIYAAAGASTLWLGPWPLYLWAVPVVLAQPFDRMWIIAEHTGCAHTPDPAAADMFRNTRTIHTNGVMRFLTWNMGYHAEHHAYPAVPFHALAELHALVGERVETQTRGYGVFHRGWWGRLSGVAESGKDLVVPPHA